MKQSKSSKGASGRPVKKSGSGYGSKGMFGGEGGRYGAGNYQGVQGMYGGSAGVFSTASDGRFGNPGSGGRRRSRGEE